MPVMQKFISNSSVTGAIAGSSLMVRHVSRSKPVSKDDLPMTISTRVALGISAAALSLSLALAPAAFAQDAMKKDDGTMKKGRRHDEKGQHVEVITSK
jgi:hypothetical protein